MIVTDNSCIRVNPTVFGYTQRVCLGRGTHNQCRAHVNGHVRVHEFGVRETNAPIGFGGCTDFLCGHVVLDPSARIALPNVVKTRPQCGYPFSVLINGFPTCLPNCVVVHRIDLNGTHDPPRSLELMVFGLLFCANHAIVVTRGRCFRESDTGSAGFTGTFAVFGTRDNS